MQDGSSNDLVEANDFLRAIRYCVLDAQLCCGEDVPVHFGGPRQSKGGGIPFGAPVCLVVTDGLSDA